MSSSSTKSHYFCNVCKDSTEITQIIKKDEKLFVRILPGASPLVIHKENGSVIKSSHVNCNEELKNIISKYPIHKKDLTHINKIELSCKICFCEKKEFILLPCFHLYCKDCILEWDKNKEHDETNCPKCRQNLNHSQNPFITKRLYSQIQENNPVDDFCNRFNSVPLKKRRVDDESEGLNRTSSIAYSQAYETPQSINERFDDSEDIQTEIVKLEKKFYGDISPDNTNDSKVINIEKEENGEFYKPLYFKDNFLETTKDKLLVKSRTQYHSDYNDLMIVIFEKENLEKILNYSDRFFHKENLTINHSGDDIEDQSMISFLNHGCLIECPNAEIDVCPLNIPFVESKTSISSDSISSNLNDSIKDKIKNICLDELKKLKKKPNKEPKYTLFFLQTVYNRNIPIFNDGVSLKKLSPSNEPCCTFSIIENQNETKKVQPVICPFSDEGAGVIWGSAQIYS